MAINPPFLSCFVFAFHRWNYCYIQVKTALISKLFLLNIGLTIKLFEMKIEIILLDAYLICCCYNLNHIIDSLITLGFVYIIFFSSIELKFLGKAKHVLYHLYSSCIIGCYLLMRKNFSCFSKTENPLEGFGINCCYETGRGYWDPQIARWSGVPRLILPTLGNVAQAMVRNHGWSYMSYRWWALYNPQFPGVWDSSWSRWVLNRQL